MEWPRRGIWIRFLIYGPIIGFLAWQAYQARCSDPEPAKTEIPEQIEKKTKTIEFPDGSKHEVQYVTPEEFEQLYGKEAPDPELGAPSGAPGKSQPD